jgi:hypothetical protein
MSLGVSRRCSVSIITSIVASIVASVAAEISLCWNIDSLGSKILQHRTNDPHGFLMPADGSSDAVQGPIVDVFYLELILLVT